MLDFQDNCNKATGLYIQARTGCLLYTENCFEVNECSTMQTPRVYYRPLIYTLRSGCLKELLNPEMEIANPLTSWQVQVMCRRKYLKTVRGIKLRTTLFLQLLQKHSSDTCTRMHVKRLRGILGRRGGNARRAIFK